MSFNVALGALNEILEGGNIDVIAKTEDDGGLGVGDVDADDVLGRDGAARG